ncbi:MAG: serine hydrolase domain-containing protein [Polyangiales bacterium]
MRTPPSGRKSSGLFAKGSKRRPGIHVSSFTAHRDPRLDALLRREIVEASVAQNAAIGWARYQGGWHVSYGETEANRIFDLASVTKPLTATVVGRLVSDGRLAFGSTVGELLPELGVTPIAEASVEALLAHRAGCPAWGALYLPDPWASSEPRSIPPEGPFDKAAMLARAASRREVAARSVYSDIGYVLLGEICARVLGSKLRDAWPIPRPNDLSAALPTEDNPWRGVIRGEVHDENAWALEQVGGDPGHAGGFGSVLEVMDFAIGWADAVAGREGILPAEIARAMIAERANGSHRLGWDGRSGDAPSSGRSFGPRTFGHLGFTGTSVWIDPEKEAIAVLLTNRTWPSRANVRIRAARPRVHDALWDL